MAFREIRINFHSDDFEEAKNLNVSVGGPFTWYMDGVMRGRFKEYSGEEVKGINIVNLCCYSPEYAQTLEARSGHGLERRWLNLLNTYQYEFESDLGLFKRGQKESISYAVEVFTEHAQKLNVPQMQTLVEHIKNSIGVNSFDKAIEKAAEEWEKINAYARQKI